MDNKINGRTPEEIKLGLVHCLTAREYRNCLVCPYGTPRKRGMLPCDCEVRQDILALIDQLQEDKKQLERERDAAKLERDALLTDLNLACGGKFVDVCCICGHYTPENPGEKCELKGLDCRWEWRGLQHG